MDNSMTTWIIVALLVLLIGAAIFMLLRRPGSDDSLDGRDAPAMDRDGARRDELDGRTAPEEAQAVAPESQPARDDAPFDQSSYDSGGATPVAPHDEPRSTHDQRTADAHPADDFLGVDATDRDATSTDPALHDPRTEGHVLAEDSTDHHTGRHADRDAADRDAADRDEIGYDARPDEAGDARPGSEGYVGAPAGEGYDARPADEQAYQEHPAGGEDREHQGQPAQGSHDGEPLTADEVLDSRGVADSDTGEGYAAAPVETDHARSDHDRRDHDVDNHDRRDHDRRDHHRGDDGRADQAHTGLDRDTTRAAGAAGAAGAGAGAASAASAPADVDEPVVDRDPDGSSAGGAVFAESEFGPGSVEPAEDGSGPEGWEVKGNTGSMLFHTADSPSYAAVRAEVWFDSEESARNAGFAHWDRRRR